MSAVATAPVPIAGSSMPAAAAAASTRDAPPGGAAYPQPDFTLLCEVFDRVPPESIRLLLALHSDPSAIAQLFAALEAAQKEYSNKPQPPIAADRKSAPAPAAAAAAAVNGKPNGTAAVDSKSQKPVPVPSGITGSATAVGAAGGGSGGSLFVCRLCAHAASSRDALYTHLYATGHFTFPPPPPPLPTATAIAKASPGAGAAGAAATAAPVAVVDAKSIAAAAAKPSKHAFKVTVISTSPNANATAAAAAGNAAAAAQTVVPTAAAATSAVAPTTNAAGELIPLPLPVEFCYLSRASSKGDSVGYLKAVAPDFVFLESAVVTGGIRMIITQHRVSKQLFVTFRGTKSGQNMLFDVLAAVHPTKASRSILRTASPVVNAWKAKYGPIAFYTGHSLGGFAAQLIDPTNNVAIRVTLNSAFPSDPESRRVLFLRLKYDPVSGFVFRKGSDKIVTTPIASRGTNWIPHKLSDLVASFMGRNWHQIGRLPAWMEPYIRLAKALPTAKPVASPSATATATASTANGDSKSTFGAAATVKMSDSYASAIASATATTNGSKPHTASSAAAKPVTASPPLLATSIAGSHPPLDAGADHELLTLSLSEFFHSLPPQSKPKSTAVPPSSAAAAAAASAPHSPDSANAVLAAAFGNPPATGTVAAPIVVVVVPPAAAAAAAGSSSTASVSASK